MVKYQLKLVETLRTTHEQSLLRFEEIKQLTPQSGKVHKNYRLSEEAMTVLLQEIGSAFTSLGAVSHQTCMESLSDCEATA